MAKSLKVLMHSNAPFAGTGYSVQTDLVTRWLKRNGHDPIISSFYGLRGATLMQEGIQILPGSGEEWGNDILVSHYDFYRPDVIMALMDSWVLQPRVLNMIPLALWAPVDHTPIPPTVADRLRYIRWPVAMSRHGEREMRQAGIDPFYVPHMVDTQEYTPLDRTQARAAFGVSENRYFVATCAANKGFPPRKHLGELLKAWAHFIDEHPGAMLYLHTMPLAMHGGLDLPTVCDFYGLRHHSGSLQPGESTDQYDVLFPDVYRMLRGDYSGMTLNNLYNAADAFILPSAGEGFGIPVLEAQASGCPVIVSDFTAQSELGEAGYLIPIDRVDDLSFTLQGSHQCNPKVSEIIKGLEWGLEHRGDQTLRDKARTFALPYDVDTVMTKHMLPAMLTIAQGNRDYMTFQQYGREAA